MPLFQSAVKKSSSPQLGNVAPITTFFGRKPSPRIRTFLQSSDSTPLTLTDVERERAFNVAAVVKVMEDLNPLVEQSLTHQRNRMRSVRKNGDLPSFREGDYVLATREHFVQGEKLCLRWRGLRRTTSCLNDHLF